MRRLLVLLSGLFVALSVYASDNVPFNGLVCDVDGLGLKVQISVKGSEKRTVSGKDGKFGLTNLKADDVPALLDEDIPQQAIVSAFRKYSK